MPFKFIKEKDKSTPDPAKSLYFFNISLTPSSLWIIILKSRGAYLNEILILLIVTKASTSTLKLTFYSLNSDIQNESCYPIMVCIGFPKVLSSALLVEEAFNLLDGTSSYSG